MSELNSFIAICGDFEQMREEISLMFPNNRIIPFFEDSFLVEHAKAVQKEAYIAEKDTKIIALGAKSFHLVAQNSLLKILEEPPRNVVFIVCVQTKTTLLPTIRSRLPIRVFNAQKSKIVTGLNFKNLNLNDVYEFLKDKKYLDKNELQELIQAISVEAMQSGISFKDKDLELFSRLVHLASLNSNANNLLTTQFATILKRI